MENTNKLSMPTTILIGSIIIGGFYYASQINKQKSIEKQQETEQLAKTELANKEYAAHQKEACLNIYKTEAGKWNNVNGWRYDDLNDKCYVQYKANPKLTSAECDAKYKDSDGKVLPYSVVDWLLCLDGLFENSF